MVPLLQFLVGADGVFQGKEHRAASGAGMALFFDGFGFAQGRALELGGGHQKAQDLGGGKLIQIQRFEAADGGALQAAGFLDMPMVASSPAGGNQP
jgi:hypothetical protein